MSATEESPDDNRTRWLVEISSWDWALGLRMAGPETPLEARPFGELMYARGLDVSGQVVAPKARAGAPIRISLEPSTLRYWTGPDALDEIGQFKAREEAADEGFSASILIPEDSLPGVLTCLSGTWRYIHIWTVDPFPRASIVAISFSREVSPNLATWIRGEGRAEF